MFSGCQNLTAAPKLPAIIMAEGCYQSMFLGCTSLVMPPELPATIMAKDCYKSMFYNCISLTTTPILPASKLEYNCYRDMFQGCSNLNTITMLANIFSVWEFQDWVKGVASSGTFIKLKDVMIPTEKENLFQWDIIPEGWTVVNYEENNDNNVEDDGPPLFDDFGNEEF